MTHDITVCIATIPPRAKLLRKALSSVAIQTLQPATIVVEYDRERTGAAATKNRALAKATTEFVAFLDDDDVMYPEHLAKLRAAADEHQADVVYSMPFVPQQPGGRDPFGRGGAPFDPDLLRRRSYIQTTSLMRTKLMQAVGGFQCPPGSNYDDWGCFLAMLDAGAMFYHLPEQTFEWNHWGYGKPGIPGNTSGQPNRW